MPLSAIDPNVLKTPLKANHASLTDSARKDEAVKAKALAVLKGDTVKAAAAAAAATAAQKAAQAKRGAKPLNGAQLMALGRRT